MKKKFLVNKIVKKNFFIFFIYSEKKFLWPLGILPSGRPLHANVWKGGKMDGLAPRTGSGEWLVLAHCAGTRRVAFGTGNALVVVSRSMARGLLDACS